MNPEVRARVIIEGDATALQKAIEKTDQQAKALNKTVKEFNLGEATDRAAQAIHERQAVEQELIRRRLIEDPNEIARRKRIDAEGIQRRQAMQTFATHGLALANMGGIAGGAGQGYTLGSSIAEMGALGGGRLAAAAGPLGLAAGAGVGGFAAGLQHRTEWGMLQNDPRLTQEQRSRLYVGGSSFWRNVTAMSDAIGGSDTYNRKFIDMPARLERGKEQNARQSLTEQIQGERRAMERDIAEQRMIAERSADAARKFGLPGISTFDRSTATGQRKEQEERATLSARKELALTERQLATSSAAYSANLTTQFRLSEEAKKLRADKNEAMIDEAFYRSKGDTPNALIQTGKKAAIDEQLMQNNENEMKAARRESVLREQRARDARAKAEAQSNLRQAEIAVLESRENTAAGAAQRYGGMGPGGRATGIAALSALQGIGIENAPPELIAQAESIAPRTVSKLREAAGVRLAGGDFGNQLRAMGAGEDVRDVDKLGEVRAEVDKKRREDRDALQRADENMANEVVKANEALKDLLDFMTSKIPLALRKLENELQLGAASR